MRKCLVVLLKSEAWKEDKHFGAIRLFLYASLGQVVAGAKRDVEEPIDAKSVFLGGALHGLQAFAC